MNRPKVSVRHFDIGENMEVEVVTYDGSNFKPLNLRLLQLRSGNRVLWTWALLDPAEARSIGRALIAAADDVDHRLDELRRMTFQNEDGTCKTCGCCSGEWNPANSHGPGYLVCAGGCEHGEVHYLEQFR